MNEKNYKCHLKERTKNFALEVINFIKNTHYTGYNKILVNQLLKAGTSIGANYREASRAESRNEFIYKVGIVLKESSETQ